MDTMKIFLDENGKASSTRAMAGVSLLLFVAVAVKDVFFESGVVDLELYRIISGLILGLAGITGVRASTKTYASARYKEE